ncbi:AAA-like domain-containing protein [Polaribacter sp.]|uniref:AAA-like domain-containing protein n=1 Tax=Polaribacter sp. TaxID=1920175 RepID=UPI003EF36046
MKKQWTSPKIIIGPGATGNYYYPRTTIENEIWRELKKGNNLLLSAPRRVGKTSILINLSENSKKGYKLIFENVQGIVTEDLFYKTLYILILNCLSKFKTNTQKIKSYFTSKGISEINLNSLKFDNKNIDYVWEINNIIPQLEEDGETIVLVIDELPEVLYSLHKTNQNAAASAILKNLRHWRQDESFKKLKFIIAGSIGIHHVVNLIDGRTSDINDIKKVHCPALDSESDEFEKYIHWALEGASISFQEGVISYLKYKVGYLVPYFINLMLDEIDKDALKTGEIIITNIEVDKAYEKIITDNSYFSDWKKRLKDYLPAIDFKFVNQILIHIAHEDKISIQQIYNLAVEHDKTDDYMDFIYDLIQDGYLIEKNGDYIFISPFLKTYWKRNNPIFKS